MDHITISGVDCYGTAQIGANYHVSFNNEWFDFTATDIEATTWEQVVKQVQINHKNAVQIEAV